MAAATIVLNSVAQIGLVRADFTYIPFTITATATVYATASGGLPFDLTPVLNGATGSDNPPYINPANVVDIWAPKRSTNGYIAMDFGFVVANVTYNTTPPFPWQGATSPAIRPSQIVATAPATIRLIGIGASAANHAAFGEAADGATTDAVTLYLVIAKGGTNS